MQKKPSKQPLSALTTEAFELAPLEHCEPEALIAQQGKERFPSFMLALALVFNDFKGLILFHQALLPSKPPHVEVSPHAGQWNGLSIQLDRLVISNVHELLNLIAAFDDVVNGPEVERLVKAAPPQIRRYWQTLVNTATRSGRLIDEEFANVLLQIRNNVTSHYDEPKRLVAGFRHHFYESKAAPNTRYAFASLGKNLDQTRFYYADAAVQGAIEIVAGKMGAARFRKRLQKHLRAVNNALEYLIEQHLRESGISA